MITRKKLSRVLAFCLTLLMSLSLLGTLAFSAEPVAHSSTGTVKISGVEDGVTVSAYRLMDVRVNENGQPQEPVYTWRSEVADWVRTYYAAYIGDDADDSVQSAFSTASAADIAAFYDALAAAVRAPASSLNISAAGTCTGNGSIDNLAMGSYLILIENGMRIYRPSAVNLVPVWEEGQWQMSEAVVEVKSSEPAVSKTVKAPGTENGLDADNANIGDIVTFDIVADIPRFPANAAAKNFAVSDMLPTSLEVMPNSIQVYGIKDEKETLLSSGDGKTYTQEEARPNGGESSSFTLTFDYDRISSYDKIHITYTAMLNSSAALGANGSINCAFLDYSNNPYDSTSWKSKEDTAAVYTYGLDITKVDKADQSTFLSGAEFELYASQSDAVDGRNKISFVRENDGIYHRATDQDADMTTSTLTVGDSGEQIGRLTLKGLDEGTWYLKETKAPGGYNLLASPVAVTITDNVNGVLDGKVTVGNDEAGDGLVPLTVENDSGFRLPVTGGMGTFLFTTAGIILMGAAVLLLIVILRKKNTEN